MRIYISGPMTGRPDNNRHAFEEAENRLTERGHFAINPHRISEQFGSADELAESFRVFYEETDQTPSAGYRVLIDGVKYHNLSTILAQSVMEADLAAVRSCDAIYLLRGWESSRGAKKELAEALANGLRVMQEEQEQPN